MSIFEKSKFKQWEKKLFFLFQNMYHTNIDKHKKFSRKRITLLKSVQFLTTAEWRSGSVLGP